MKCLSAVMPFEQWAFWPKKYCCGAKVAGMDLGNEPAPPSSMLLGGPLCRERQKGVLLRLTTSYF